ncbi:hypothetical protein P9273_29470 [Mesorhizobium sp. WSM4935]|uniref:hypothetical protein n=1 Tax=Mesorhizobium sp. WSM4935 TaxID=3038547 RepID=UPI0024150D97|nr:hypothetical protein [Mesorhizobium sp. WSM4935]MDG4879212.1 hypothetical protein [Mesorhizobium sp. WSM4935]
MKKSLLSAVGLAVSLAFSMPVLGYAAATKTTAPAATTDTNMTTAPATTSATKPHQKNVANKTVCKPTKKHKCPVRHARHHTRHAAAASAAPKTSY